MLDFIFSIEASTLSILIVKKNVFQIVHYLARLKFTHSILPTKIALVGIIKKEYYFNLINVVDKYWFL
jgi:hypothetical protein